MNGPRSAPPVFLNNAISLINRPFKLRHAGLQLAGAFRMQFLLSGGVLMAVAADRALLAAEAPSNGRAARLPGRNEAAADRLRAGPLPACRQSP